MEKEAEQILAQVQSHGQQLQGILMQKQTLQLQAQEIENALMELENAKSDVYKAVGPILLKSTKQELKKELSDAKEETEVKIKALEKQENRIREKLQENQEKFQKFLPKPEPPKVAG